MGIWTGELPRGRNAQHAGSARALDVMVGAPLLPVRRWTVWRACLALASRLRDDGGTKDAATVATTTDSTDSDPNTSPGQKDARYPPTAAHSPDERAFDVFFTQHERPLYGYLRRLLPSDEVAVEIAQEAFFRAWTHFETVRTYDRPEAWLYRVATNLAISSLRRQQPLSFSHAFSRSGTEAESDEAADADALTDPLDLEGKIVERDAITRALRGLPERQRAALLLRAVQGFSCEEVAEALGVTVPNARQILSRGRERFRQLYDASHPATGPQE